jgi:hypothetical protein
MSQQSKHPDKFICASHIHSRSAARLSYSLVCFAIALAALAFHLGRLWRLPIRIHWAVDGPIRALAPFASVCSLWYGAADSGATIFIPTVTVAEITSVLEAAVTAIRMFLVDPGLPFARG